MKDRERNTRRHAFVAPAPKPWNRCPSCRSLVDLPEPCFDGAMIDCPCGLELTATCFGAEGPSTTSAPQWELIVTVDIDELEREPHECDFCGEEEPCLCRPEEDDEERGPDCMGCGYCGDCIEATKAHLDEGERAELERHAPRKAATS